MLLIFFVLLLLPCIPTHKTNVLVATRQVQEDILETDFIKAKSLAVTDTLLQWHGRNDAESMY